MKQSLKFFCAVGTLTLPCLVGCGGGGGTTTTDPVIGSGEQFPQTVQALLPNGLTATVTENASTASVGGVVVYRMALANNTGQPITFQTVQRDTAPSDGVGDALTVTDAKGNVVFPRGAYAQVLTYGPVTTLAPGKVLLGTVPVSDDALVRFPAAGQYSASVVFTTVAAEGGVPSTGTVGPLPIVAQ